MKPWRYALAAALVLALLMLAVAASLWLASAAIGASERKWCSTLALLTARPVPRPAHPAADPARQENYLFYLDLVQLKRDYRCP